MKATEAATGLHATLQERVDFLERTLGDSADKHQKELESLRVAHARHDAATGKHAGDLESLKAAHSHHAGMAERLAYIEKTLGDSADKHAREVAALKAAHD